MITCEVIRDLLPLYRDEAVSISSVALIEEHLKACEGCKSALAALEEDARGNSNPIQQDKMRTHQGFQGRRLKRNANTLIACIIIVLGVAFICGLYIQNANHIGATVPYEDMQFIDVQVDYQQQTVDIVTRSKSPHISAASIAIRENDEMVRLVFITCRELLLSKWEASRVVAIERGFRAFQPEVLPEEALIYKPFDRCEIYYVNELEINVEADYERLRSEGKPIRIGE